MPQTDFGQNARAARRPGHCLGADISSSLLSVGLCHLESRVFAQDTVSQRLFHSMSYYVNSTRLGWKRIQILFTGIGDPISVDLASLARPAPGARS